MNEHTPGPWHCQVRKEGWDIYEPISAGGFKIAHVNTEPNARLIAAAPQLLEALCECADQLEVLAKVGKYAPKGTILAHARTAIAAAGEQP